MNWTTIEELIKFFGILGGACITVIKVTGGWFKLQERKAEEGSLGLTKIKELIKADKKLEEDIDKLQECCHENKEEIMEVKKDHREFTNRVWDYMTKSK
jgi:hypothetical protein